MDEGLYSGELVVTIDDKREPGLPRLPSPATLSHHPTKHARCTSGYGGILAPSSPWTTLRAVSYTHLTLPTT